MTADTSDEKVPDRIYLQIHDNPNDEFAWTHCTDRINDDDVEYVRAPTSDTSDGIVGRLAHFEKHQLEQGDEYGAEVLHRAAAHIEALEAKLAILRPEAIGLAKEAGRLEAENARLREALMDQIRLTAFNQNGKRPDAVAVIERRGDLVKYACPKAFNLLRALLTDTEENEA